MPKTKPLQVRRGSAQKIPLKVSNPLTAEQRTRKVKSPNKSLFERLQNENKFVSGTGISRIIGDIFGNFGNITGDFTKPFDEKSLPKTGVQRMQQLDDVVIYPQAKKKDTILIIAAIAFIFLISKSK